MDPRSQQAAASPDACSRPLDSAEASADEIPHAECLAAGVGSREESGARPSGREAPKPRPTVSVVIPTRDRRELVLRALESVMKQTRTPDQIVVVDDGSRDGTAEAVGVRFPRAEILSQAPAGVSAARNRGVRATSGEWIAFLDSDDEWKPAKLARQLEELERHPTCAVCHCDEIWIRRGNQVLQRKIHRKRGGWIFEHCLARCAISPSAALMRRSLFDEVGGFDESLPACEDYDLWLRVCALTEVAFVDEPLVVKYGGHDDQLSKRFTAMDRFRLKALARLLLDEETLGLGAQQRVAARSMLRRKLDIYVAGARRRGRHAAAEAAERTYRSLAETGSLSGHPRESENPDGSVPGEPPTTESPAASFARDSRSTR